MIDTYDHIPNGNRSYYLSRSQPPFFAYLVELEAHIEGDKAYVRYLPQLQTAYAYWMEGAPRLKPGEAGQHVVELDDGSLLNRYWVASSAPRQESWLQDVGTAHLASNRPAEEVWRDLRAGAESGWDFSSRWLGDGVHLSTIRTTAIVPIDLNSLMYSLERTIEKACQVAQNAPCTQSYGARAVRRQRAIDTYLWNAEGGYYVDYDWQQGRQSSALTAAALFPLYAGVAFQRRADDTAQAVRKGLLRTGGLATSQVVNGQQWDEPNGWVPLQLVAVQGLSRYGQTKLATEISDRFLQTVQKLYRQQSLRTTICQVLGKAEAAGNMNCRMDLD